jgi:hypothetical protein
MYFAFLSLSLSLSLSDYVSCALVLSLLLSSILSISTFLLSSVVVQADNAIEAVAVAESVVASK